VGFNVIGFNRGFGPNNSIGEIDVETSQAIIEVTVAKSGKLGQVSNFIGNATFNPSGKPVILYAPNYRTHLTSSGL
jgi:hypothetical protein